MARDARGRVKPGGPSLNPGGQPKWVAAVRESVQECCEEGAKLLVRVIRGKETVHFVTRDGAAIEVPCGLPERLKAIDIAFSYGLAKPKQALGLELPGGADGGGSVLIQFGSKDELLGAIRDSTTDES